MQARRQSPGVPQRSGKLLAATGATGAAVPDHGAGCSDSLAVLR